VLAGFDFSANDRIDLHLSSDSAVTYIDVLANTVREGAHAIINLSDIYNTNALGAQLRNGSVLAINNVTLADLNPEAFALIYGILIVG
jgi:hypothetical protein